jgi:hypothetical protein
VTTFVLGAGASVDAGYPLAGQLGPALQKWIKLGKLPSSDYESHLDQLVGLYETLENFEQILTDLDEGTPGSPAAELEILIRHTISQSIRVSIPEFFNDLRQAPALLYERFATQKVRPGDVIISFNYDVAFERQLKRAGLWEIGDGYGFSLRSDAIPSSRVKMFKLHGSTNWLGMIFHGNRGFAQMAPSLVEDRPVIFGSREFEFLGYPREVSDPSCRGISSTAGLPALILPTLHKLFFEQTSSGPVWEPFWQCLWSQAESALACSQEVIVIGYSMAIADEKARELLLQKTNRDAAISVFCGGDSSSIRDEFLTHGFKSVKTSGLGYLSDYLSI